MNTSIAPPRRSAQSEIKLLHRCLAQLNDIVLMTEAEPFEAPGPKIMYVNKAFEQRTGYSAAEVRGHGAGDELLRQIAQRLRGQLRVSAETLETSGLPPTA